MKALPFKIPRVSNEAMVIQEDKQPYLYDHLHMHPEIQVTYIVKSSGTVYLGDYVGTFSPHDIFIVGSNVPHVFMNDSEYYDEDSELYAHGITIFLDKIFLEKSLLQMPEAYEIDSFLNQTQYCWKATNKINELPLFEKLPLQNGLDKMIAVLDVIRIISRSNNFKPLTSNSEVIRVSETDGKRLNDIIQYTLNHYQSQISLEQIAEIANMTVPSFCRFFKQRTRKTYITFLNDIRINQACKLLLNKDLTVLQISVMIGFNNLSNFNRQFKKAKGITPSSFKVANIKD